MNERRIPVVKEELKHKKRSQKKGLPRSKHKHMYETVLLTTQVHWNRTDFQEGKPSFLKLVRPTKVCIICGRISDLDHDQSFYEENNKTKCGYICNSKLSKKALSLPKWYADDFFSKFAHSVEECRNENE